MAIPVYLWLTDHTGNQVKGSVDIQGREGSIEIIEFMHSVDLPTDNLTGKITGKRIHGDFALIKEIDSSSPYLYKGVSTGQKFKQAELKFFRINYNGQEEEYFRIMMENVRVNGIEPLMFDIKNTTFERHNHLEAFYLAYEIITWHYLDGNIIHTDRWDAEEEATV
ncbi:type VI secretion system tube protein Hcp [Leclercia adecarboxylata]|uniref:Hcp family type VI secretion system effector n=1 Tax=Leclercia TaxID=83654 RepID=UPI000CD2386F|nr:MULTISPECIES: type VI secretion system tube protein TssD [Leclercia]POV32286.1 type VI secretion system tube protein Hcp [Leclercia sp. LSNIH5]POW61968.1 type VI secretion system tube protein Hcp [Leclercia sp. LSNIH2]AUU83165.1 type VI secretion system tube protein Hcp [Leclercia sp. LSNIH1]MEB5752700.1 type VI secretion system tube protein Hcp [Leclercia adecarboxylata]QGW19064.1 type VI secretion system tube protein Hcp [Leclercia sp. Colony189]